MQDFIGDVLKAAENLRLGEQGEEALQEVVGRRPEYKLPATTLHKLSSADWLALLDEAESHVLHLRDVCSAIFLPHFNFRNISNNRRMVIRHFFELNALNAARELPQR